MDGGWRLGIHAADNVCGATAGTICHCIESVRIIWEGADQRLKQHAGGSFRIKRNDYLKNVGLDTVK